MNISLGGVGACCTGSKFPLLTEICAEMPVMMDTGSPDLWIYKPSGMSDAFNSDIPAKIEYGLGDAKGTIAYASFSLGNNTIQSQGAFA